MPYNPSLAFTNSQQRDDGLRNALGDFMTFFKTQKANKEAAEKQGMIDEISKGAPPATGAPGLGMDAAGMPTGLQGEGVAPAQAAQQHLAGVKAKYLMKYGNAPVTGADMLNQDLEQEQKRTKADLENKGLASMNGAATDPELQRMLSTASTVGDFNKARTYAIGKFGVGAANKLVGSSAKTEMMMLPRFMAGEGDDNTKYVINPNTATARPITIDNGSAADPAGGAMPGMGSSAPTGPILKGKPSVSQKTPDEIEAAAAAAARGKASVGKPMTEKDQNAIQMKLTSLATARRQLQEVEDAFGKIKDAATSGKGRGWIPTEGNNLFDKKVAALKPTIQAMTRVPGIGAQSDFETRLAMAPYPGSGEYSSVNEESIKGLRELITELETGYREMGSPDAAAPAAGAPKAGDTKTNAAGTLRFNGTVWERVK